MKSLTLSIALLSSFISMAQNIGIGTNNPSSSAQLDVSSTTKGMLAPRMNSAQRNAIASPAKGLLVYDTDLNSLYHYNGSGWSAVGGGGGFSLPFEGSVNLANPGFKVTNSGFGPAIQAVTTNEFGYALQASNTTNYGYSVYAYSRSPNGIGVYAFTDSSIGVKGESGKGIGIDAISTDSTALRARIIKAANTDPVILATHAGTASAVDGSSLGFAIKGTTNSTSSSYAGVYGVNNGTQGSGVLGLANFASGYGVQGSSTTGTGVYGYTNSYRAVAGVTISGTALYGNSTTGYGLESIGKIKIAGGNTSPEAGAVLTSIDANGNAVWKTDKVAFGVTGVNTNYYGLPNNVFRRIHFAPVGLYDLSNSYQLLIGTNVQPNSSGFIIPTNGVYHFDLGCEFIAIDYDNEPTITQAELRLQRNRNGTVTTIASNTFPEIINGGYFSTARLTISRDFSLEAGDFIYCEVKNVNATSKDMTLVSGSDTYFSGHLVKIF